MLFQILRVFSVKCTTLKHSPFNPKMEITRGNISQQQEALSLWSGQHPFVQTVLVLIDWLLTVWGKIMGENSGSGGKLVDVSYVGRAFVLVDTIAAALRCALQPCLSLSIIPPFLPTQGTGWMKAPMSNPNQTCL